MHDLGGREFLFVLAERIWNAPLVIITVEAREFFELETQHLRKVAMVQHVGVHRPSDRVLLVAVVVGVAGLCPAVGRQERLQKAFDGAFLQVAVVDLVLGVLSGEERSQRIGDGVEGEDCARLGVDVQTREEGQVAATATTRDCKTLQVDGAVGEGRAKTLWVADELDTVFDVVEDLLDADLRREAVVGGDEDVVPPAEPSKTCCGISQRAP